MSRVLLVVTLGVLLLLPAAADAAESTDVVVSQIYGGGGNAGATFRNDYVELFNAGSGTVDLAGWTVQYATAAGATWQATALAGTIAPGRSYLVQLASNADVGAALPTPDATGTSNLGAASGKIALVPVVRGSSRISSATAMRAISRAPDPPRRFPTPRPRFVRTAVALTRMTMQPTSRRPRLRHGTQLLRRTCVRARLPPGRAGP